MEPALLHPRRPRPAVELPTGGSKQLVDLHGLDHNVPTIGDVSPLGADNRFGDLPPCADLHGRNRCKFTHGILCGFYPIQMVQVVGVKGCDGIRMENEAGCSYLFHCCQEAAGGSASFVRSSEAC